MSVTLNPLDALGLSPGYLGELRKSIHRTVVTQLIKAGVSDQEAQEKANREAYRKTVEIIKLQGKQLLSLFHPDNPSKNRWLLFDRDGHVNRLVRINPDSDHPLPPRRN